MDFSKHYFKFAIYFIFATFFISIPCLALTHDKTSEIDKLVQIYYEKNQFAGSVLVAEAGKVIYKKGVGWADMEWQIPNAPDTKFRIGSITKQFTSMIIMQLVEEGKIDLQGFLSNYLPFYREDTGRRVTIHHLLVHTSGIPSYTGLPGFFQDISRDPYPAKDFVKKYCSGDLEFDPGSQFKYNNSGYFILGVVIEEVTGKSYEQNLQERIFEPVGMVDSGYDRHKTILPRRAEGYERTFDGFVNAAYLDMSLPYAAGSLYSTVEDLYLWDRILYTEELLSKKAKKMMFSPHEKAMGGYGYGWAVSDRKIPGSEEKTTVISHGGGINGFVTLIERYVDLDHLIVLFNNTGGANLNGLSRDIFRVLSGQTYDPPKEYIGQFVYEVWKENGIEAAISFFKDMKKNRGEDYIFHPQELNRLGYYLMGDKRKIKDAVEIFKLNVETYPKNANAYDSLAEAYLNMGEKKKAVQYYAKSLELNPENRNAVEQLNKLLEIK